MQLLEKERALAGLIFSTELATMAVLCICGVCIPYTLIWPMLLLLLQKIYSLVMSIISKEKPSISPAEPKGKPTKESAINLSELPLKSNDEEIPYLSNIDNWTELTSGDRYAIVKFTAKWCKPCKAIDPVFQQISKENKSKAVFFKVDVDEFETIAAENGALSIPLFVCYKNGEVKSKYFGKDENSLKTFVNAAIRD
jgi:thioredoxin